MAAGKPFMNVEARINLCREYTKLWSDFFKTFADGLEGKKIYPNEEKTFNQIITLLAMQHYKFAEMMGDYLPDPDGILDVLGQAVSLQNLKELSDAQFSKLQVEWHTEFIAMNKCLGKLLAELPTEKRIQHYSGGQASPIKKTAEKAAPTSSSSEAQLQQSKQKK